MALSLHDALNGAAGHLHLADAKTFLAAFLLAVIPSKSSGAQAVPAVVGGGQVDFDIEESPTRAMIYRREMK